MADQPLDIGPGTLFNTHMSDLGNRMMTFCNFLLLVDGGILSITIAAFLSGTPPMLPSDGLYAIRNAWYLLTAGLLLALCVPFFAIVGQMSVHKQWKTSFATRQLDGNGLELFQGPAWVGKAIRGALYLAFACSILGVCFVSYGAVQLLRLPVAVSK